MTVGSQGLGTGGFSPRVRSGERRIDYRPPAPQAILPPSNRLAYAMERASLPLNREHASF